jgi:hypothetical protein
VHRFGERRLGVRLSNEATLASATSLIRQTSADRLPETRGSTVDLGPRTLFRVPRPLRLRSRCSVHLERGTRPSQPPGRRRNLPFSYFPSRSGDRVPRQRGPGGNPGRAGNFPLIE